jgi:hypothetical protein
MAHIRSRKSVSGIACPARVRDAAIVRLPDGALEFTDRRAAPRQAE